MGRRKRYSAEFKREALRRAKEPGVTDVLVAEELGINARHPLSHRALNSADSRGQIFQLQLSCLFGCVIRPHTTLPLRSDTLFP